MLSVVSIRGKVSNLRPRQKRAGVSISESLRSSENWHIGREFNTSPIWQNKIVNSSQDKNWFCIILPLWRLALLMIYSHNPPKCVACGGITFQIIMIPAASACRESALFGLSTFCMAAISLLHQKTYCHCLYLLYLFVSDSLDEIQISVEQLCNPVLSDKVTASICTVLLAKQTKSPI